MSHWRRHFTKGGTLAWSWGNCFAMLGMLAIIVIALIVGVCLLFQIWVP